MVRAVRHRLLSRAHRAPAALILAALLSGCASRPPLPIEPPEFDPPGFHHEAEGTASWYGPGFAGRRTASGEVYDPRDLTAAHKTLPFGTRVLVTNLDNQRRVWVRINDRGPFIAGRIIDLSRSAADAIDMVGAGTARVRLRFRDSKTPDTPGRDDRYIVQLGAFRDRAMAELEANRATASGHTAWLEDTGELVRVRVGPFPSRGEAESAARVLSAGDALVLALP